MAFAIPLAVAVATNASTIAIVGAAMGAVGAITGNKGLAKIGGLIGLAGGVMSLANSTGALAGGEALAGGAEGLAGDVAGGVTDGMASALEGAAAAGAEGAAAAGAAAEAVAPAASQTILAGGDAAGAAVEGVVNAGGPSFAAPSPVVGAVGLDPNAAMNSITNESLGLASPITAGGSNPLVTPSAGKGIIGSVQEWFKQNPTLAKVGGEFIKGGFEQAYKEKTNQQLLELRGREVATKEEATALQNELIRRGLANAAFVPGSTGMSLNSGASLYAPGAGPSNFRFRGGIINGARGV